MLSRQPDLRSHTTHRTNPSNIDRSTLGTKPERNSTCLSRMIELHTASIHHPASHPQTSPASQAIGQPCSFTAVRAIEATSAAAWCIHKLQQSFPHIMQAEPDPNTELLQSFKAVLFFFAFVCLDEAGGKWCWFGCTSTQSRGRSKMADTAVGMQKAGTIPKPGGSIGRIERLRHSF